jgi:proteasome lid subunit RPN8/RPN11
VITLLDVPSTILHELYNSARSHAPAEVVGMLAGRPTGQVTHLFELPNVAGLGAHLADPRAQFEAEQQMSDLQLACLAVYHSHPGGGTDPSPLDVAFAQRRPDITHVIVAVDSPSFVESVAAFRMVGERVVPVVVRSSFAL